MSTWQVFSDERSTFRWEISDEQLPINPDDEPNSALGRKPNESHRLPSMADLLLQGIPSKLTDNWSVNVESPPMFRTGIGKPVMVKNSSVSKALSILGDEDGAIRGTGQLDGRENGFTFSKSMFQNGSGDVESPQMFQTASGKSVVVKQSSMSKALSILDEGDDVVTNTDQWDRKQRGSGFSSSMFQIGVGKTIISSSMFQTGSGKRVDISSAGLLRAKTMLGLEKNNKHDALQSCEQTRKQSNAYEPFAWKSSCHMEMVEGMTNTEFKDDTLVPISPFNMKSNSGGSKSEEVTPDFLHSAPKQSSIKFHTAGGRSISVSSDALHRARSLLGDPDLGGILNEGNADDLAPSIFGDGKFNDISANKENDPNTPFSHRGTEKSTNVSKNFICPIRSTSYPKQSSARLENIVSGSNLIKKFDAEACDSNSEPYNGLPCHGKPLHNGPQALRGDSLLNVSGSATSSPGRSSGGPLADISNSIGMDYTESRQNIGEKRMVGRRSSVSPFKKPRSSRFITPLNSNISSFSNGLSTLAPEQSSCRRRVSTRYPVLASREYVKEYFGAPPSHQNMLEHFPDWLRRVNPRNAEKHTFHDGSGAECIGAEAFRHMMSQSGASLQHVSKEWIANHYKWIVWKLACYERCYPFKSLGKFLTVSNVLEELKYRYEREANHGHRSAIRKILEGDAPPSSMLVLCISSIHSNCDQKIETHSISTSGAENTRAAKIELTDGWYSLSALLDVLLSNKLAAGKLFVGQKLRIWGAGLCGWVGPVLPLETSGTISLSLHINGTYRAHWADRLGFCKDGGAPLAFRCIKGIGGAVPSTLVGITRIYPLLYRERLSNGGFVVRSERMEAKMIQLYNHRCSVVAEGIMAEFHRDIKDVHGNNDHDSEEGAKILRMLETAAEPEVLMAEMSSEQLNSFATYQAKLEALKQSDMQKSIEKALNEAGLNRREVTPFVRIRVDGLTSKSHPQKCPPLKGLITIWNPTEKQRSEFLEGQAYAISGLTPLSSDSDTLYLQARGSTTKWRPLSPLVLEHFEPFFSPRKAVSLSNLGDVPLSSEFDIAAFVVYVGEMYTAAYQKKQWVFVTDGSISELQSKEPYNSLLAISFCSPSCDSFAPINFNLAGSTVCFCDLIKRAKDQTNNLWVAEATENSTYFISYDHEKCSHLKDASSSAQRWAKLSSSTIEMLRGKVLSIIDN
ncbi:unnamed protein product [Ilex paraguariensis]|uniref:Tower domain-containing protein n=1 Tax=Ilex paraguariensis TaxID=185542 RepID=A0ABC8RZN9_9AQUA